MSNINYPNKPIQNPVGVDVVCEEIALELSDLCYINNAYGRVHNREIDGMKRPIYYNRENARENHEYIDMSMNRDFCNPMYSFVYPYGKQKVLDEDDTNIYMVNQRMAVICFFNIKCFDLQNPPLNHIFTEELKAEISTKIRNLGYCDKFEIYEEPKDVLKEFDIIDKTFYSYPYGCLRFDFLATFDNCINETFIECS